MTRTVTNNASHSESAYSAESVSITQARNHMGSSESSVMICCRYTKCVTRGLRDSSQCCFVSLPGPALSSSSMSFTSYPASMMIVQDS